MSARGLASGRVLTGSNNLLTSLTAAWKFQELTGTRFDSHHTNHLTAFNGPTNPAGKIGTSVGLTAASVQYLTVPTLLAGDLDMGVGDWTMAGWAWISGFPPTRMRIACNANVTNAQFSLQYETSVNRFQLNLFPFSGFTATIALNADAFGAPSLNTFYFICCRYTSSTRFTEISVNDGVKNTGTASAAMFSRTCTWNIGHDAPLLDLNQPWNGRVDDFNVWQRLLTDTEITMLYNGGIGLEYPFSAGVARALASGRTLATGRLLT